MGKTTNCVDIPESLLLPAHKAAICSSATVDLAQRSSTPGSVSLSPSRTTLVPEEDGAGTLDWQTSLLQKVLPRPKTADLVQPTIATASHSQQQRTPSKQLRSPAVEPAHIHDSTSADQLRSSSLISTTQSHSLSSALQPEQQSSTLGKVQLPALHYAAIFLDPLSRAKLLSWAQPMHSCLTADHMTLLFRPSLEDAENLPLGTTVELSVLAKMHDSVTQVPHPDPMGPLNGCSSETQTTLVHSKCSCMLCHAFCVHQLYSWCRCDLLCYLRSPANAIHACTQPSTCS